MKDRSSLTPEEVAVILNIAKNTVYELIKRGELTAYRIGRKLRIDPQDVEIYKKKGKKIEMASTNMPAMNTFPAQQIKTPLEADQFTSSPKLVICGQDVLLDILARHLERHPGGTYTLRHHVGSFNGLLALYQEKAHLVSVHLWDGDNDVYNLTYVRYILCGTPAVLIHLACRMQGFYVAKNNPKSIMTWQDLIRPDVLFINREKGCGTRVLLDEKMRREGIDRKQINGYEREENSHLAVASAVSRGEADVALGNEKASLQVRGIEFVPLQKERYELVILKDDIDLPPFQAVIEILQSQEFKNELEGVGDYDLTELGNIVAYV
ncbi:MAG: helix-turn-helix transcriptional regulator [Desulfotomaculaceae bacterium]|nr:helix-turn-helix transcriptional regulator [Desulfotomaculaceae bacterium]MDD4767224.1 helix-turn-helix transcriptional regulator [Desulfotomaculaceae bacterium]